jgi:hypothetical protein
MEGQRVDQEIKKIMREHKQNENDALPNAPRQSDRELLDEYAEAMNDEGKEGARKLAERSRSKVTGGA